MIRSGQSRMLLVALLVTMVLCAGSLLAQEPPPARGRGGQARVPAQATAAQVQALFDAMVVVEAQKVLALNDEQYPQFVTRLKALQEARRRHQRERAQLIQEIARLTNGTQTPDEGTLREKLKALGQIDAQAASSVARAYDGLDQVLDVRQQARFRVFEEQIERRKFQFLLGVRRNAAARAARGGEPRLH